MSRRQPPRPPRVFQRDECEALAKKVIGLVSDCEAQVDIETTGKAKMSFARGDANVAADGESVKVSLQITTLSGQSAEVSTSRIDDEGLRTLTTEARTAAKEHHGGEPARAMPIQMYPDPPKLYFASTLAATGADIQADAFHTAAAATEKAGLIGAGDFSIELATRARINTLGLKIYERQTYGEFSLTARSKDGTGSGWGWSGFEDWSRVKVDETIARAVDLGKRSMKPVAVEPGRYTVILEPTATAEFLTMLPWFWSARSADGGYTIFGKDPKGTNKIGMQMIDSRLSITSDPWDADLPASTIGRFDWMPVPAPVTWFEKGILKNLEYDEEYAREKGREKVVNPYTIRLQGEGQTSTLEEMIASTKRGIWVNRISHIVVINGKTILMTGTTRDGTFLIEGGKITKAIKNFRFTESPFFVLNKLDAFGPPERGARSVVAPRLKVRDFDFTSLTDAV